MTTSSHNTTSSSHFALLVLVVLVSTCTTNGENIRKEKGIFGKGMFSFCNEGTTYCRGITTCTVTQKDHADGNCPAHKKNGGCSPRNRNFMAWRKRCPVTCGQCMPAKEQLFTLAEHEQAIAAATAQATESALVDMKQQLLAHEAAIKEEQDAHTAAVKALRDEQDAHDAAAEGTHANEIVAFEKHIQEEQNAHAAAVTALKEEQDAHDAAEGIHANEIVAFEKVLKEEQDAHAAAVIALKEEKDDAVATAVAAATTGSVSESEKEEAAPPCEDDPTFKTSLYNHDCQHLSDKINGKIIGDDRNLCFESWSKNAAGVTAADACPVTCHSGCYLAATNEAAAKVALARGDTVCSDDEYESQAPVSRSCSRNTKCADDEYESQAPTATMDRVCITKGQCAEYQVLTIAGTATSPTTCTNKCQKKHQGVVYQYYNTDTQACEDMTVCPMGEHEAQAPTDTTDRSCGTLKRCVAAKARKANSPHGAFDFVVKAGDGVTSTDCDKVLLSLAAAIHNPYFSGLPIANRDAAARVAHAGIPVLIHKGHYANIKLHPDGTVARYYKHLKWPAEGGSMADINFVLEQ